MDGRPIPGPVGVLVGLGDTMGIEDDDSDLTRELAGVVVYFRAVLDFDSVR